MIPYSAQFEQDLIKAAPDDKLKQLELAKKWGGEPKMDDIVKAGYK